MKILLSNDDGYLSSGIKALYKILSELAEITVVAPANDCSGLGNAITLRRSLSMKRTSNGFYYVDGTPADCVHLALRGFMRSQLPDLVISGINHGANMGDDTIYSGTVGAATEGFINDISSIAVSLNGKNDTNLYSATKTIFKLVENFKKRPFEKPKLLNINIPNLSYQEITGIEITRLGRRGRAQPVTKEKESSDEIIYWLGGSGEPIDAEPGTDFHAIASNRVSVTPLGLDRTLCNGSDDLSSWFNE